MAPRSIFFASGPHVKWREFHATPDYVGWGVAMSPNPTIQFIARHQTGLTIAWVWLVFVLAFMKWWSTKERTSDD